MLLLAWNTAASAGPCELAAATAEQRFGLPAGLLAAIGHVESGLVTRGTLAGSPFAVDIGGEGRHFANAADAAAVVRAAQAAGVRSVDVGCFQVNLLYHPTAFRTLEEGFDPAANAREAGRFLRALYTDEGGWELAVARYHSSTPELGTPYARAVMASWRGLPVPPLPVAPPGPLAAAVAAAGIHLPQTVLHLPGAIRP